MILTITSHDYDMIPYESLTHYLNFDQPTAVCNYCVTSPLSDSNQHSLSSPYLIPTYLSTDHRTSYIHLHHIHTMSVDRGTQTLTQATRPVRAEDVVQILRSRAKRHIWLSYLQ